jgi:dTDP-4-dehydrorhamnose reductase
MRILVIGKNGQLGRSIQKLVNSDAKIGSNQSPNDFIFVGREELELSSESSISHYFNNNNKFDIIINCAAYTQVDKAEQEAELANQINHLAVKQLAIIASNQLAKLLHISTDFVFDGESNKPYLETDIPNPINVYGVTKLAGEKALQALMPINAIIIRTSWVYSDYGNNFVETMLRLGRERDKISVVNDQMSSPTYAIDLADAILEIIRHNKFTDEGQTTQIYNYSNEGEISWHEFAKEIFKLAEIDCRVSPISIQQYPTPAKRPRNTFMNKDKIVKVFNIKISNWKSSLNTCMTILKKQQ